MPKNHEVVIIGVAEVMADLIIEGQIPFRFKILLENLNPA